MWYLVHIKINFYFLTVCFMWVKSKTSLTIWNLFINSSSQVHNKLLLLHQRFLQTRYSCIFVFIIIIISLRIKSVDQGLGKIFAPTMHLARPRSEEETRRIYRGADKIFSVSKCKNWFFNFWSVYQPFLYRIFMFQIVHSQKIWEG